MRAYLAARYSRREELGGYREQLRAIGIEVTSRWLDGTHQYGPDSARAQEELGAHEDMARRFAMEDVEDLRAADVVISFTEIPRQPSTNRGGRHVELGLALGLGKLIINVGPRENAFHYLADVESYARWEDAYHELHRLSARPSRGMPVLTIHTPLEAGEAIALQSAIGRVIKGALVSGAGVGFHIWRPDP
jgi:nucleoside 2-deoxyribosyltransferase